MLKDKATGNKPLGRPRRRWGEYWNGCQRNRCQCEELDLFD